MKKLLFIIALFLCSTSQARDSAKAAEFRRHNPCPKTHKIQTSCLGYVVDHVIPLCAGGADDPKNMQWQTLKASYAKDTRERAYCRAHPLPKKA